MTYTQFMEKVKQMNKITELEYGESGNETEPQSLTGAAAHKVAMKMFPRGKL